MTEITLRERGLAFRDRLAEHVPAQSLAMFRILFGLLILWDFWRFMVHLRIWRYWVEPEFHFAYPGFSWVGAPSLMAAELGWLVLGLLALMVTLGLFYRLAIIGLTLLFGYFFLIDAAEYLNHFYLVLLYLILLCFMPAARIWSLDALIARKRGGAGVRTVPYAAVFMLRAQTEIMLVYAGLVKLTPDWLAGEPLGLWMRHRVEGHWFEPLFQQDWVIIAACWLVIALHVLGAPLLLWRRTRLAVFLIYGVFHIGNAWSFNIGIFPWLTITATTIFFDPDWPARLLRRDRRGRAQAPPARPAPPVPPVARRLSAAVLAGMALWIAVQLFLPIRGAFFDSEIRWSGDGHRFSWRMRIYDRAGQGHFIVTDRQSGQVWIVDPDAYLTPRQTSKMIVRADMIHQFATHLGEVWRAEGRDVSVRAEICQSLNGRPCQTYIDPEVDLTQVAINPFGADPWVMPLEIPVWGVANNRNTRPAHPDEEE